MIARYLFIRDQGWFNRDLIALGLKINLEQCLLEDLGESEGLNHIYKMLKKGI